MCVCVWPLSCVRHRSKECVAMHLSFLMSLLSPIPNPTMPKLLEFPPVITLNFCIFPYKIYLCLACDFQNKIPSFQSIRPPVYLMTTQLVLCAVRHNPLYRIFMTFILQTVNTWRHPLGGNNPSNAELNPICHLLALLGAHHILHVSRIRVKIDCGRRMYV